MHPRPERPPQNKDIRTARNNTLRASMKAPQHPGFCGFIESWPGDNQR
jgi:hypothetical protein